MPTNDERGAIRFLRTAICMKTDCDKCREASEELFGDGESSALCCLDQDGDGAVWRRLADLIEPTAERCDRDALLRLADYLDEDATLLCQRMIALPIRHWGGYEGPMAQQETWIAHQIRKACGVAVEEVCDGLEVTE